MNSGSGAPVNRAPIKSALFTLVSAATFPTAIASHTTWASTPSRRLKLWNAVDPSLQPALFMVQHRESYLQYGAARLTRRYLDIGLWCYARTDSDTIVGDDILDIFEFALETSLQPDRPEGELTLGGLAYWCRITREDGLYIRDPGDIDGQALLVLPVRVLLP